MSRTASASSTSDRSYHVHEQPTDYDLVLNTDMIGIERSAQIVVRAAAH